MSIGRGDIYIGNCVEDDLGGRAELLVREGLYNPERDSYKDIRELIQRRPGAVKVAKVLGELTVVGSVYIGDGIGVVQGLVVAPEVRRCGIGGALLDAAEQQLIDDGRRQFELQIDDDQDELKDWYRKRGFTPRYVAIGLVKPLGFPDRRIIEEGEGELSQERIRDAFMTIYFGKGANFTIRDSRNDFSLDTRGIKKILKESSVPALRHAYFAEEGPELSLATMPWVVYSTEKHPLLEDHVITWTKKKSSFFIRKPEGSVEFFPNDTHLFLRRLKDVREHGISIDSGALDMYDDYLCYDQANKTIIPFSIDGREGIVRMSEEEGARMVESMVACAEAYRLDKRHQEPYVFRRELVE